MIDRTDIFGDFEMSAWLAAVPAAALARVGLLSGWMNNQGAGPRS
jgi:hypothetical protein